MTFFGFIKWKFPLWLCAFIAAGSLVQAQILTASEPLQLRCDYARFRGDDENMYIEVYYSVSQKSLTYKHEEGGFKGAIELTMLAMAKDSVVYADRWLIPHIIKDTSTMRSGMNLIGAAKFGLPEGEYTLKVLSRDKLNPGRKDSLQLRLPVKMTPGDKMALSDIELASSIKQHGNRESPFYKNTLEVVPQPEGLYGEDQKLYFYAEAYNLLNGGAGSEYQIKTLVYDAVGREVISRERTRKRSSESNVILDNFGVDQLKSGTYSLVVGLLDSAKKVVATSGKKFYVYNRKLGIDSSMVTAGRSGSMSEYASVPEADLDQEFDYARYEATDAERSQYKSLRAADAKRKFLSEFWARRPLGHKQEYLARVSYANMNFAAMGRKGYQTDRGRVYIVYGPPSDYERHPSESEYRPYEIWTYQEIQGGVIFAFVQRANIGEYELVHSTHRNELHDESWRQYAQLIK
jgi:GWxTD domain-containing protein